MIKVKKGRTHVPSPSGGSMPIGGRLWMDTTQQATTGTSGETLAIYPMPANTIKNDGDVIRIEVWGTTAANGNAKNIYIFLGGQQMAIRGTSANNNSFIFTADIIKDGSSSQHITAFSIVGATPDNTLTVGTKDWTTQLDVEFKALTATAAGDLIFEGWSIDYMPTP